MDPTRFGGDAPAEEVTTTARSPAPKRHTPLGQGVAEFLPTAVKLTLECGDRNAQPRCRLVAGEPFEVAQHQRLAVDRGQAVQFLVQSRG